MIPFRILNQKFEIPTRWQDVSYAHYIELIKAPNSLPHYISIFTRIPVETLQKAELKNLERIALALSFLTIAPKYEGKPTPMVGLYTLPKDVTLQSLGQFEDLRGLLTKLPEDRTSIEGTVSIAELYLEACAIYVQKIKDGAYDYYKVADVMRELRAYSCIEITQTGAFFLFKPVTSLQPIKTRYQNIAQRVRKLIQDLPGYQKTLDLLRPSSGSPEK